MTKWFIALLFLLPSFASAAEWTSGTSKTDVVEGWQTNVKNSPKTLSTY